MAINVTANDSVLNKDKKNSQVDGIYIPILLSITSLHYGRKWYHERKSLRQSKYNWFSHSFNPTALRTANTSFGRFECNSVIRINYSIQNANGG